MNIFSSASQMFGHNDAQMHYQNAYHQYQPHHAKLSHEVIAGAAGFAAMHAYEAHLRATGHEPSHSLMKEMLAGIAASQVDRLVETKGLNYIDRRKAHKMSKKQAHYLAHQRYGPGGNGRGYAQSQRGYAGAYGFNGRGAPWGTQGCPSYGGSGYPQQGFFQGQGGGRHHHNHHHHHRF